MMNYVVDRNADVRQVQSTWSYFFFIELTTARQMYFDPFTYSVEQFSLVLLYFAQ